MALRKEHPLCAKPDANTFLGDGTVVGQKPYGPNCLKMTLTIPWKGEVDAGQFVHVHCDEAQYDPLLRRPLSIWDAAREGEATRVELVYAVVGKGTAILAQKKPGERVGVMGPLGRGWKPASGTRLFVAGGVGIVPFHILTKQILSREPGAKIALLFGGRTESLLYGIDEFPPLGVEVHAATEDGSRGYRGLVTGLMEERLDKMGGGEVSVFSCGPDPMMEAVMEIARRRKLPCQVSMERWMGCGLGACGACVTPVRAEGGWRYSRICLEGPVYDAGELVPAKDRKA